MGGKPPVDPRWRPERAGSLRWRRDETFDEWSARKRTYLAERERKEGARALERERRAAPYRKRSPKTLQTAVEKWGLTLHEIQTVVGSSLPEYPTLPLLPPPRGTQVLSARTRAGMNDGADGVRVDMVAWVIETAGTKQSEALCDLDCGSCPRGRLLLCAAQNLTAAAADGFPVYIHHMHPVNLHEREDLHSR